MGRVFRLWRGVWKKNERLHWHFVPTPADYGFTMYMDSPETFDKVEAAVREHYVLGESSPLVITYGMPDWMMFPSGQIPPMTITNTTELLSVMNRRPPLSDVTLLLTLGAKDVADYQFLSRSDFTIGSTTFVVGENQDERARARYESLVFGERIIASEAVMNEIFGEQGMLVFHRVALEMGYADKVLRPHAGSGVFTGAIVPFQQPALPPISPSAAPSVLWDVGLDLFEYPEFFNAQRGGNLVSSEDFWNGLMEESCNCCDHVFVVGNGLGQDMGYREGVMAEGALVQTVEDDTSRAAIFQDETDSSSGSTRVVCSQLRSEMPIEGDTIVLGEGDVEKEKMKGTAETSNETQSSGLSLTLACGNAEGATEVMGCVNLGETSSDGSGTEGAY
ncbi:hypothetical protein Bca4012_038097 [Brassica carinata]